MVGGAVALGEAFGGRVVVAGLIQGLGLPLRVGKVLRRFRRFLCLQQALALLVRAQPQVIELEGITGPWQDQQQGQAQQPAAPSGTGGQQQQRQQQPMALVGPGAQLGGLFGIA